MADNPAEIGSIMNIILPNDIPTGVEFIKQYMNLADNGAYYVKDNMINTLKSKFRGRVSVLKSMDSDVTKEYIGQTDIGGLFHSIIDIDQMSRFQSDAYTEAYEKDTKGKTQKGEGYFHNSRQASLFVYPPKKQGEKGVYGNVGFKTYINESSKTKTVGGKKTVTKNYTLKPEFRKMLEGRTPQDTLTKIRQYSSKYAKTLEEILAANDKCIFIYSELVTGGGAILFSKLLELLGYTRSKGGESSEGKRYALLTGETTSPPEINTIKNRFNQKDNMTGKYIQIIIGSSIVTEGFSLRNIQEEHILTPHWNNTPIDQALARGLRVGSHQDLIDTGINPIVKIHQHGSLSDNFPNIRSIDLVLYKKSEVKDISIKQIERLMKESAFDCGLVYERNKVNNGVNGSRNCDYQDCDYVCDGLSMNDIQRDIPNTELDYSTFQLYYSKEDILKIIKTLETLFRTHFTLHLTRLVDHFPMYSGFELMAALRMVMNRNIVIKNKYGFSNYLKEENNVYFLVGGLSDTSSYFSSYYTRSPVILTDKTFVDLVEDTWKSSLPSLINKLKTADQPVFDLFMKRLPIKLQETYIEASVLAKKQNTNTGNQLRDNVLRYFKDYITKIGNVYVSTYLQIKEGGPLRCLIDNKWSECTSDIQTKLQSEKDKKVTTLLNNTYGYYGIYDPEEPDYFAIRKVDIDESEDLRKKTTGQNCKSWKKEMIIPLVITIKLDYDLNDKVFKGVDINNRDILEKNALKNTGFKKVYGDQNKYKQLSNEDLIRVYYWSKKNNDTTCTALREWFRQNELLTIGKSGRKKKTDVPQK